MIIMILNHVPYSILLSWKYRYNEILSRMEICVLPGLPEAKNIFTGNGNQSFSPLCILRLLSLCKIVFKWSQNLYATTLEIQTTVQQCNSQSTIYLGDLKKWDTFLVFKENAVSATF